MQYRERYQEGYNNYRGVAIKHPSMGCNTASGIRRATIGKVRKGMLRHAWLQYRERYQEGYNIAHPDAYKRQYLNVAIPRAVSGGLQYIDFSRILRGVIRELQYRERYQEGYN